MRLLVSLLISLFSLVTFGQSHITTHCNVTYYHPVTRECNSKPLITADGSKIDLKKLKAHKIKWCAISRDLLWMFPKDKPRRIWIEGFGVYEVHDVMNKRHKHMVDILIHPSEKGKGMHKHVKIHILK